MQSVSLSLHPRLALDQQLKVQAFGWVPSFAQHTLQECSPNACMHEQKDKPVNETSHLPTDCLLDTSIHFLPRAGQKQSRDLWSVYPPRAPCPLQHRSPAGLSGSSPCWATYWPCDLTSQPSSQPSKALVFLSAPRVTVLYSMSRSHSNPAEQTGCGLSLGVTAQLLSDLQPTCLWPDFLLPSQWPLSPCRMESLTIWGRHGRGGGQGESSGQGGRRHRHLCL
jgi:hypothetical protein